MNQTNDKVIIPSNLTGKDAWLFEIRFLNEKRKSISGRMDYCLKQIPGTDNDTIRLIYDNAGTYEAIKRLKVLYPDKGLLELKKVLDEMLTR
jgi:hypothetical protein